MKNKATSEFGNKTLRAETNHYGPSKPFQLAPRLKAISSDFPNPDSLRTARHRVPSFYVYDGVQHLTSGVEKVYSDRSQDVHKHKHRLYDADFMTYARFGSKKGWLEDRPTHTSDGFLDSISKNKWKPLARSEEKQSVALRDMPAIDIENNARGIGHVGSNSGNGGMAGGYKEVTKSRLATLPIPMGKYNWTGTRLKGTRREAGFTAGYKSMYSDRPAFQEKRVTGISRIQ